MWFLKETVMSVLVRDRSLAEQPCYSSRRSQQKSKQGIYWFSISLSVWRHLLEENLDVFVKNQACRFKCLFSSIFLLASCVILGNYFILEASAATSVKWGVYLFHGVFVRVNIR